MPKLLRKLAYATAATTSIAAACVAVERTPAAIDPDSTLGSAASSVIAAVRFTRSLRTAAVIMSDYRLLFARHSDYNSDQYKTDRTFVHRRSADRLLNLARQQGAVYVKIGQHIASMNHAVPPEYSSKLKSLEDRAAYRPYWQVERSINRQLPNGQRLQDVFDRFDKVPVAAASLAQVHRATLRNTEQPVAVKIQYPGLEALVRSDLTSIRVLSRLLRFVFPFFNMDWVVDQFRENLKKELDFRLEAESANRTAISFQHDNRVFVPRVYPEFSTSRLLVMEYIDGCRVDDVDALRRAGVNTHQVAQAVINAFAQMIFLNGFIHCDPHAGNMLVRCGQNGKFQLFLLDHGLYRELDDSFRQSYCRLWKGFVLRRSSDVERACSELGAPGFANLFSVFLLNRSWRFAKRIDTDIRVKMSSEELSQLRQDLRDSGLKSQSDISSFVENIPDDLLLVFKMNALVRNVNKALGASVNRFKVNARYAVRGLRRFNDVERKGDGRDDVVILAGTHAENGSAGLSMRLEALGKWMATMMDCVAVEMQLAVLDVALILVRWWFGGRDLLSDGVGSIGPSDSGSLIG